MRSGTIAVLLGILLALQQRTLPDPFYVEFLPLLLLIVGTGGPRLRPVALFLCGSLWVLYRASLPGGEVFPENLAGRDLEAVGVVASVPLVDWRRTRFDFRPEQIRDPATGAVWSPRGLVRLSWYRAEQVPVPGTRWRLRVRLKPPHGFANPGGFDYEGALYRDRVRATGYVRETPSATRLEATRLYPVARLRQRLDQALQAALPGSPQAGLILALAIGQRDAISPHAWEVLRVTGTTHLMAISGLHVGLVAGLVFALTRFAWSRLGRIVLWLPAPRAGAAAALVAASGYAALAGFSVPTQRAMVMIAVCMLGVWMRRAPAISACFAWALLLVVAIDPLSVASVGFWLSFGAVAVILYGSVGRLDCGPGPQTRNLRFRAGKIWRKWGRVQLLVAIGLLPLTLLFFQQYPVISPVANLIAVPWTGFVVVPLTLLGTLLVMPFPDLAAVVLELATAAMQGLWWLLDGLAARDWVYASPTAVAWWAACLAVAGVFLLLLPRGFPNRWIGFVYMLPLVLAPDQRLPHGAFRLSVLDVGQGLSVVVQTRDKVLLYDTGPRFGDRFDAGRAAVVPFLRHAGVGAVDALILSHAHTDHTGGASSVLAALPVARVLRTPQEARSGQAGCHTGLSWRWNGVAFTVLHPDADSPLLGNNSSCVLRVSNDSVSALLAGDIERGVEEVMANGPAAALKAQILVVPHHGSSTSSTMEFLAAVRPSHAVFSAGHMNRFGFPDRDVVSRYHRRGITTYDTARSGAITFNVLPDAVLSAPQRHRERARRFWHHDMPSRDVP